MTVQEEEEAKIERGRCVLVGVQIDSNGRELLTWALNTVTKKGDRVVAVHISRVLDLCHAASKSTIRALDEFLSEFEDLCTLKQVSLVGRVSRGISIRKTLVKEAALCAANTVVVGANSSFSLGGAASVAKYCSKKLPLTTALFAFHNGKLFLQREPTPPSSGKASKLSLGSILHPSVGMDAKAIVPVCRAQLEDESPKSTSTDETEEGINDHRLVVYEGATTGSDSSSSISILVRSLPELRPGWPLLRRAVAASIEVSKDSEARRISVVEWVMRLPNRSLLAIEAPPLNLAEDLSGIISKNSSFCRWFQYDELSTSTNNFSSENLIGKGGSSQVYRGCLQNDEEVAIKLSKFSKETSRDFTLEVEIITKLHHERIVPLMGICVENMSFLSVYGYFSKGSLEENLHGKRSKPPLDWEKRFKVAVGIAEALRYLHDSCSRPVIHRDIKSSNILLNNEFEPQLSDFGLALWAPTSSLFETHSDVVGTFGYLAPEYFMYGKVSNKIDVYAYGVVLLELLTGRKPINDESPKGQESLVMWATPILERGELKEFLDPNLDGSYDEDQLRRMILVASLCIARPARLRPHMSQVLGLLKGEEDTRSWVDYASNTSVNEDEEAYPLSSIGSHLSLALLDVEEDNASTFSFEQNLLGSLDDYLRDRWSRTPSFD